MLGNIKAKRLKFDKGYYEMLIKKSKKKGDHKEIMLDLDRTFPKCFFY